MRPDRLRHVREQMQYSQQELSERLGVSIRQIHRYETGTSEPVASVLKRMAQTLEVSVDYLVGLVDDPMGTIALGTRSLTQRERELLNALNAKEWEIVIRLIYSWIIAGDQPNDPGAGTTDSPSSA